MECCVVGVEEVRRLICRATPRYADLRLPRDLLSSSPTSQLQSVRLSEAECQATSLPS